MNNLEIIRNKKFFVQGMNNFVNSLISLIPSRSKGVNRVNTFF